MHFGGFFIAGVPIEMRRPMKPYVKHLTFITLLTAVYFVIGKLGLMLAFVHASATAVWPASGFALTAFLVAGYRVWPAVFLGAFLVNLTTLGTVATSIGIGTGNMLEGLIGAYLVNRFANGRNALDRARDFFRFVVSAALVSTMVSATIGVTSLALGGFADWANYGIIWLTWWLGDSVSDLVVAPLLIHWIRKPLLSLKPKQTLEAAAALLCLLLVGLIVFGGLFPSADKSYPLEFVSFPFLIWIACRFGPGVATMGIAMLSGIAIRGTLVGFGPFVRETTNESLLLLQAFMGVAAVMTLALGAVVSERRHSDEERSRLLLHERKARLEADKGQKRIINILESITEAFLTMDHEWRITYLNRKADQFLRMMGTMNGRLLGKNLWDEVPAAGEFKLNAELHRAMAERVVVEFEEFYLAVDGWFEVRAYPFEGGLSVYLRNVTERKEVEQMHSRLAAIVESSDDAIIGKTLDGIIQSWNTGAEKLYGYSANEVIRRPIDILTPADRLDEMAQILEKISRGERIEQFETVRVRKDGVRLDVSLTVSPVRDASGRIVGASAIARDITERNAYTAALTHRALHDALTDLPNRTLFYDRLQRAILAARRTKTTLALLFLDLDRFKEVNDRLGHHNGDVVLKQIGPRLQTALRESDVLARLGGDEFAIVLSNTDRDGATLTARKILNSLKPPFVLEGLRFHVRTSIGIALFPLHGDEADTMMRCADMAMYAAKQIGHRSAIYTPELNQPSHFGRARG
jgi:diguanylate cyclase (GGDEF)-like protein/PAS domain S-box-containing protein